MFRLFHAIVLVGALCAASSSYACNAAENKVGIYLKDAPLSAAIDTLARFMGKEAEIDPSLHITGKFFYPCVPVDQVIADLERQYPIKITLTDTTIKVTPRK